MLHPRFIFRQINDSRKQAVIFALCVALSLLTLTSLGGFSTSVRRSMLKDARQLHAADIRIHSHYPFSQPLVNTIRQYEEQGLIQGALVHEFYSMARNAVQNKSILCNLKVVEKDYPFYGKVQLASGREFANVLTSGSIIVEQTLLDRLKVQIGSNLQIGFATLKIADIVTMEPDKPVSFFSFGPRIFIAATDLKKLDLIKKGSRVQYNYLIKVNTPEGIDTVAQHLKQVATERQESIKTFREADSRLKRFFDNFLFFLNLIGIFTLLLAGIGIQTSLYALLRKNIYTIAVLKSFGSSSNFIMIHFIAIIMVLGAAGTLVGLILSFLLQLYFPVLFAGIIPSNVTLVIAWDVVFEGLILGTTVVALFSFLPLRRIKDLKPAFIFRKEIDTAPKGPFYYITTACIGLFFCGMVVWQLKDIKTGFYFILVLLGLIGLTTILTNVLLILIRKHSPRQLIMRQAVRGLFRPNNATRSIIITLSASLSVIFAIYLVDQNLHSTFIKSYPPDLPNAYFLDIQPDQKDEFADLLGMDAQYYPIIRARLISINDRKIVREKEMERKRDNLAREFSLTRRNYLLEDEQMLEGGNLFGSQKEQLLDKGELPVSVLDTVADIGNIKIGDLLVFKVQGIPLKARVTSLRTRPESRVRPFFYFVFPENLLKDAPQTIFSAVRINRAKLTELQNILSSRLPNISVIDIGSTVEVLARIIGKMSTIIQFFTSFSIIAGLLIIISSIFATRLARIREAVYFKVLGARPVFVSKVFALENLFIALLCGLLAISIAQTGSWILCRTVFDISYHPFIGSMLVMLAATVIMVLTVGLWASLSILRQKPIAFLRDDEQD